MPDIIRILCDAKSEVAPVDANTGARPFWWRGSDPHFEIALKRGDGSYLAQSDVFLITLEVKAEGATDATAPLMIEEIGPGSCSATFSGALWDAKSDELATVIFTDAEAALAAGNYQLIVRHEDSDGLKETFAKGIVEVVEDNAENITLASPPSPVTDYYSKSQIRAIRKGTFGRIDGVRRLTNNDHDKILRTSATVQLDHRTVSPGFRCHIAFEVANLQLQGVDTSIAIRGINIPASGVQTVTIDTAATAGWVTYYGGGIWWWSGTVTAFTPQSDYGFTSLQISDYLTPNAGNPISIWDPVETGGYQFTQPDAGANDPIMKASGINSRRTLEFDNATNKHLAVTLGAAVSQPDTVVVLGKLDAGVAAGTNYNYVDSLDSLNRRLIRARSTPDSDWRTGGGGGQWMDGGTRDTGWHLFELIMATPNGELKIDNVSEATNAGIGAQTAPSFIIGNDESKGGAGSRFHGEIALFGHVVGAWDGTARTNFYTWINTYYGLSLPTA